MANTLLNVVTLIRCDLFGPQGLADPVENSSSRFSATNQRSISTEVNCFVLVDFAM